MTVQDGVQLEPMAGAAKINSAPSPKKPVSADSAIEIPKEVHVELSNFSTNELQQFNANFNSALKTIRLADRSLAEIETKAEQMQSEMQTFLKMYPPYPPESEKRVSLLKNYAAIRNQIEQFSIPQDTFDSDIIERRFHDSLEGLENLELPELSMASNDKEIKEAAKTLGQVKSYLAGQRMSLLQDARELIETVS